MSGYSRIATEDTADSNYSDPDVASCSTYIQPQLAELTQTHFYQHQTAVQLCNLPAGILDTILDHLPPDSLLDAACVCREWQRTVYTDKYKKVRVAWYCKSFLQPGLVASFRTRPQVLSFSSQRRLRELREAIGKTMMLQL